MLPYKLLSALDPVIDAMNIFFLASINRGLNSCSSYLLTSDADCIIVLPTGGRWANTIITTDAVRDAMKVDNGNSNVTRS